MHCLPNTVGIAHSKTTKVLKDENRKESPLVTSKQHISFHEGPDKISFVLWNRTEWGICFASSLN